MSEPRNGAVHLRNLRDADYPPVIARVDEWWGGRAMTDMLPRLFFQHFADTSFAAVDDSDVIVGFLCGFVSQSQPSVGYIHFVGVAPQARAAGVGAKLYDAFFAAARSRGCTSVKCVTSPANEISQRFHQRMGFALDLRPDYDGPGVDRYVMTRNL